MSRVSSDKVVHPNFFEHTKERSNLPSVEISGQTLDYVPLILVCAKAGKAQLSRSFRYGGEKPLRALKVRKIIYTCITVNRQY